MLTIFVNTDDSSLDAFENSFVPRDHFYKVFRLLNFFFNNLLIDVSARRSG